MSRKARTSTDVSEAYHRWARLWEDGLRLALSASTGDPREAERAWERLIRGHARALAERDLAWGRIAEKWRPDRHGG
ncbi:MAG: hypothetical protein ACUVYA_09510 [Planctomycetota bacterium]